MEDSYKNLVSVPVNLMTGEAVAAGALQVTCENEGFKFYDVEAGRLSTEMACKEEADGKTVKNVGNAADVNKSANADGIYANVRFEVTDPGYEGGKGKFLKFTVTGEDFCDWNEDDVAINAWDIQY